MEPLEQIEDWARRRAARLVAPDGWLALIGRWEIDDGVTDLPIGPATKADGGVTIAGQFYPFGTLFSKNDQQWEVARLAGGAVVRVRDARSPAIQAFRGIDRYPADLRWRVTAEIVPDPAGSGHTYANGTRVTKDSPGRLAFTIDGVRYTLGATYEGKDRLFVLFGDATNGDTTYGAGRFAYVPYDGGPTAVLDFNQAFNPPCALTEFAVCPLVADEDRLPIAVTAGERYPLLTV